MPTTILFLVSVSAMFLSIPAFAGAAAPIGIPVNVIFDADMCLDSDDAMALAMVHALHDRHEANLVAVTLSLDEKWCASYADIINTFYGHPEIPIGATRNGLTIDAAQEKSRKARSREKREHPSYTFAGLIVKRKDPQGLPIYPHRLTDGSQAPEAVTLLRKVLAAQPDGSVVMIQVGNSANFGPLLDTRPDAYSDLSGYELVRKKVRILSVMASTFQDIKQSNKIAMPKGTGINIFEDVASAQKIFTKWPSPIVVSGSEIGLAIKFPGLSIEHDFSYVDNHPVAQSYQYMCDTFWLANRMVTKCPDDRHTADLTATLYALRPDRNYFSLSNPGKVTVLTNGNTRFDEDKDGNHRYLIVSEEQTVRAQEAMMMLVSQPPVKS